jgi:cell division protease FtsH
MSFRIGEEHVFLGKEIQEPRDFSEGTAQIIDEEVQKLLREADDRSYELLSGNRDKLEALVNALMQREELLKDEIDRVLRGEPLPPQEAPRLTPAEEPLKPSLASTADNGKVVLGEEKGTPAHS